MIPMKTDGGYIQYFRIQLYLLQMISNVQSEMKGIKLNTPLPTCFCQNKAYCKVSRIHHVEILNLVNASEGWRKCKF